MGNSKKKKITIYGAMWCPDCRRVRRFLAGQRLEYQSVDIEHDSRSRRVVEKATNGKHITPTITLGDGSVLINPTNDELGQALGLAADSTVPDAHDIVIVGGGPAGLTAAIYAARDGLSTLILERAGLGGYAATTAILDNFPGFDEGITGAEFAARLARQAARFGVETRQGEEISGIRREGSYVVVSSVNKRDYLAHAVLVSTGSRYRTLGVPGEDQLTGMRIHYCATCDGPLYKGREVLVIGGGNSGFEEDLALSEYASQVRIVGLKPEATAHEILQEKVASRANIEVVLNHSVTEFKADGTELAGVVAEDIATGQQTQWHPAGVFVFIGLIPNTQFLPRDIELDGTGFIRTDSHFGTKLPGVYAAGDVRSGATKQAVAATGEGAAAAIAMRDYLRTRGETTDGHAVEQD